MIQAGMCYWKEKSLKVKLSMYKTYRNCIWIKRIKTGDNYTETIIAHRAQLNFQTAIYKTRNTGTGNRMRGMQGTRGMFTRIPGNLLENSGECSHFTIPRNAREDSGECSRRFRGMLSKILGNVQEDSGESLERFREMLLILNESKPRFT